MAFSSSRDTKDDTDPTTLDPIDFHCIHTNKNTHQNIFHVPEKEVMHVWKNITVINAGKAPFGDLEVVDLLTDGFEVALFGQPREKCLHADVELLLAIKLRQTAAASASNTQESYQRHSFSGYKYTICEN